MCNESGYIRLYRKMKSWEWYDDIPCRLLFLHLLLSANWKAENWQGKTVERGQIMTSITNLSEESGLTIKQTRTALKKLASTNEVGIQTTNKKTLITICNFDSYQSFDEDEGQTKDKQRANKGHANGHEKGKQMGKQRASATDLNSDDCEVIKNTEGKQMVIKRARHGATIEEYKNIYNISPPPPTPVRVHTCESDLSAFGPTVTPTTITTETLHETLENILNDPQSWFLIAKRSGMQPSEVRANLDEFEAQVAVEGKSWRNTADLTTHVANWMRSKKRYQNLERNGDDKQHTEVERKQQIADYLSAQMAKILRDNQAAR